MFDNYLDCFIVLWIAWLVLFCFVYRKIASLLKMQDVTNVKRLFGDYIRPVLRDILISISLMLVVAASTTGYTFLIQKVLDKVFVNKDRLMLMILPVAIVLIGFCKNFALFLQTTKMAQAMAKISTAMKFDIYKYYIKSDISVLGNTTTGSIVSMCAIEIEGVAGGINSIITTLIRDCFTVVFLIIFLFYQNPVLASIGFIGFPLVLVPIILVSRKMRKFLQNQQSKVAGFATMIDDTLRSPKIIKSYNAENFEIERMDKTLSYMLFLRNKISRLSSINGPMVEFISSISFAFVIWYGGWQVITGKTTAGVFFSFLAAMAIAYKPVKSMSGLNAGLQSFFLATKRYYEIMDKKPEITTKHGSKIITDTNFDITFTNVSFKYPNTQDYALHNLNLTIKHGEKIAIVGKTGAGKSSVVNLLLRFYDVTEGSIKFGETDIKDIDIKSVREQVSYIGQDAQLFDDTIQYNIVYTKQHTTDQELETAAKYAHVDEFVDKLPLKYQTMVGQSGGKLSGGQKQRIMIARAFLYNKPILIMDEATSALDSVSERYINDSTAHLTQGKTSIIIAHRLSTIIGCDKICVMHHGQIVEFGTHEELLAQNGHYTKFYNTQFSHVRSLVN